MAAGDTILCPHCGHSTLLTGHAKLALQTQPTARTTEPEAAGAPEMGVPPPPPPRMAGATPAPLTPSFEMRLGTYWLVRVGIVMVLTGLVFFGNLAYHKYITNLGPGGKVALLYLASGLLLGAGAWWQRKAAKESLRNYAQVLFAGGLAAVYFTTYAAHYVEPLRVIDKDHAGVAGGLLLAWAGFMVWIADRKKSEVLAFFAVGLAYYTSFITHVGYFTLWSNLVLTAAAVVFLVRNRWAALTFASLIASYAAYGYWRFFDGSNWHWASPEEGLWTGAWFLMSYWVVFTTAVFLSRDQKFADQNRAAFLTFNNGALFTMFVLTMLQVQTGGFWKFSLTYGGVLLVLAELARRTLASEPLAKHFYLTQGLLLVTVGFISKFAGLQLALILAAESVILLMLGHARKNWILLAGAYLAAGLSVGWGMDGMREHEPKGLYLGMGLGALMLWNVLWAHWQPPQSAIRNSQSPIQAALLRAEPTYFSILALLIWLVATWDNTDRANFPLILATEGLLLTLSIYVLRVREIALLAQAYLALAQLFWLGHFVLGPAHPPPWWNPVLLIVITLALSHWWQKQKVLESRSQFGLFCQGLYALAIVGVLYLWLSQQVEAPSWLALTSLLALGLTAYGVLTRAWFVAAFGQIFILISGAQFVMQLTQTKPPWPLPLAPIAALSLLSLATVKWFQSKPDATGHVGAPLLEIALVYRWLALAMSIWWVCEYIPARERIWLLALLGTWAFIWAGLRRNRESLLFSAAYNLAALVLFWLPLVEPSPVYWPNLVVIVLLLAQRQVARRVPDRYPLASEVHGTVIIIGGLSLWRFLTLWIEETASGSYLTAGWSAFALVLFTAGIVLRERMYRWLGLAVLAWTLGQIVIIDVWKLEPVYRVLSFMALGIVLLVLGFIYNKYQEKIREWL
jgi:uncharacterized membrane protein